ncbi:MAG: GNAT family N-acetyltransferase [Flavobacteriales bacterium]|nr:GNAT family N-acetyltransferase [Flavobacteriales bacterium]
MSIEIRSPQTELEWQAYYDLRYRILRAPLNQPLGSEKNDGDATGVHFALYEDGILRAIARLDKAEPRLAQVRFVAVDDNLQGRGYGRMIMQATEEAAKQRGDTEMILQARDYAVDFYLKLGYTLIEKSHLLFGVLQHFKMSKRL